MKLKDRVENANENEVREAVEAYEQEMAHLAYGDIGNIIMQEYLSDRRKLKKQFLDAKEEFKARPKPEVWSMKWQ